MATMAPGHVGKLKIDQETKLQEAWKFLQGLCGVQPSEVRADAIQRMEASQGIDKEVLDWIAQENPATIREAVWAAIKHEHPDAVMLRFVRARKWDIGKSIAMLLAAAKWRKDIAIEDKIVRRGEAVALQDARTKDDEDFMRVYRSGISYVRSCDKLGRPVYIVKTKVFVAKAQTGEALRNYILHNIESVRILVRDPYDTACLIFDLTDFNIRNVDYEIVKFILMVFESRYPETLGVVCIHNSPWLFQGVWRVIKPWIDPDVVAKIRFTKTAADLAEVIPKENLQADRYGGSDPWVYQYVEPRPGENDRLADAETRCKIQAERDSIISEFEKATSEWIASGKQVPATKVSQAKRDELAEKVRLNYWELDPYVRARTYYDRSGFIDNHGHVTFSPGRPV